jgi:pyridoxal phosphate enzyme (YggS family)
LGNKTAQKTRFFNSLLIEKPLYRGYAMTMETLATLTRAMQAAATQSALRADKTVLLGASKGQSAETVEQFIQARLHHFGENRVREAADKWLPLREKHKNITLHLIGPLQTNKVDEALELFDVIQTLDRIKLADAIAKRQKETAALATKEFYIQVNTGEEPQKAGIAPMEAAAFIAYCKNLGLNVTGLMCVPPAKQMPAPHFALLRKIALESCLPNLNMGMSEDFETAIRMGSSCVRIGRALFGERT